MKDAHTCDTHGTDIKKIGSIHVCDFCMKERAKEHQYTVKFASGSEIHSINSPNVIRGKGWYWFDNKNERDRN